MSNENPEGGLSCLANTLVAIGSLGLVLGLTELFRPILWIGITILLIGLGLYFVASHYVDTRCPQCNKANALRITRSWSGNYEKNGRSGTTWTDYRLVECRYCQYHRTDTSNRFHDAT